MFMTMHVLLIVNVVIYLKLSFNNQAKKKVKLQIQNLNPQFTFSYFSKNLSFLFLHHPTLIEFPLCKMVLYFNVYLEHDLISYSLTHF